MILPLGDAPNPRGTPAVTWVLIGLNVAIYVLVTIPLSGQAPDPRNPLLTEYLRLIAERQPNLPAAVLQQISAYDLFVYRWGFRPVDPSLTTLFLSMFLHGGFAHLAGNMLFLWIYGDNVEHRLGAGRFLLAYLGTGIAATLFHMVFDPESRLPMVGASGAISGVLGFYFLWFPRNQVRLLVFLFPFLMDVILVPARLLLGFYLVVDNLLPFLITRGTGLGGVAYGAHIGGFVAALAAGWLLDRREIDHAPREYRARPAARTPEGEVRVALAEGRYEDAARAYFSLSAGGTRRLLTPDQSLALARWLAENGHDEAAFVVFRRHLRDYPRGPGVDQAHLGAGLLQLEAFSQPAAAWQHFLDALESDPSPEVAAAARRGLAAVEAMQKLPYPRHH